MIRSVEQLSSKQIAIFQSVRLVPEKVIKVSKKSPLVFCSILMILGFSFGRFRDYNFDCVLAWLEFHFLSAEYISRVMH